MILVPVEPVPITPTRLPVMSRSSGHALVCTRVSGEESRAGDVGHVGLRQQSQRGDQVPGGVLLAAAVRTVQVAGSRRTRAHDIGVQLDVAPQVEAVHHVVEVGEDVLLLEVARRPVAVLEHSLSKE